MALSATVVGGIVAGVALLAIITFAILLCMLYCKRVSNRNSETGSSEPSALVELRRGGGPSSSAAASLGGPHGASRQFTMEELEKATNQFNENNLIGRGSFGFVYKGLLADGTVVAIKRRAAAPKQEFVEEVAYLSGIRHRHLVTLLGYCQDSGYQMLVFEYVTNGSMCNHLYEIAKESSTKLEFRQRLSIAMGAAKGLCHLHRQRPPLLHGNFKTANVLVDENFIAKVSDAGLLILLKKIGDTSPSQSSSVIVFRDPEIGQLSSVTEASDVFSFGVFLLELVTGREASQVDAFGSNESTFQWIETQLNLDSLVDHRLVGSFTAEGMRDLLRLTLRCIHFPGRERPGMEVVVLELDQILEKEIMRTTGAGEGTTTVTLGSQLFTS